MTNNLRIIIIADKPEQMLLSEGLHAAFPQPQITFYKTQDEFQQTVKLYNCDFLMVRESLVNSSFYTYLSPF